MAKKTYVVAEGMAFTAIGHIFGAGEEISEKFFSDKVYFAKLLSEKKIVEVKNDEVSGTEGTSENATEGKPAETEGTSENATEEESTETTEETSGTKKSTSKGGK